MASKKVRQRISYVLEDARSLGHRLGVNGLAVDSENNILYSGGRDGVVCAWELHLDKPTQAPAKPDDSSSSPNDGSKKPEPAARPHIQTAVSRAQTQAHTHWINDITLASNNSALVTASSDLLVKIWRPREGDNDDEPAILGKHADYVKCVASPGQQSTWVASGGLDRRICLWDLQGGGKILEIDVSGQENAEKGSVYALRANHNVLASGGPESTVRLWDPRAGGKNITKFVGHTDNVRSILVNDSGDTIMTASSDQTVKVWSVTAGRCIQTLTMHNDSVWSLYSDAPDLSVFYSSDRSGLVVKTDVRGNLNDWDNGLSVAVAQEHNSISKVVASNGYIWTATSSSSINRWADVNTTPDEDSAYQAPRPFSPASETVRPHSSSVSTVTGTKPAPRVVPADIPAKSILRISNTAIFPVTTSATPGSPGGASADGVSGSPPGPGVSRKGIEIIPNGGDNAPEAVEPMHRLPVETIEGNFGLVKHRLLNDRRRVLTLDTAGEVILWDIIACKQIRQFGKRHLEDVEPEVNTTEAVAPWCSVDVSSGQLTVVLEQYNCFDAEMYADELEASNDGSDTKDAADFRDDQRINLGKWVLRYLFANLIDEEVRRDEAHRAKLNEAVEKRVQAVAAASKLSMLDVGSSPVAANGDSTHAGNVPPTPGIGVATPLPTALNSAAGAVTGGTEKEDYFSNAITSVEPTTPGPGAIRPGGTPVADMPTATAAAEAAAKKKEEEAAAAAATSSGKGVFGKKIRMGMSFGTKKINRSASTSVPEKPAAVAATADEHKAANGTPGEDKSESASSHEKEVDDCFVGAVQRMHNDYEKQLADNPDRFVVSRMQPCQPDEAPVLRIPDKTKVIIQEELKGGSIELYRGTVGGLGQPSHVDKIERCAPIWLGEAILANAAPIKESTKISFLLLPYHDELPPLSAPDGSSRLNANRMLRVKKILAYVAEKLEPPAPAPAPSPATIPPTVAEEAEQGEAKEGSTAAAAADAATSNPAAPQPETEVLKPEEYLELYCNEQRLPHAMSLATVRAHIWKNSNDIMLYYKSNGRKKLPTAAEAAAKAAASAPATEAVGEAPANGDGAATDGTSSGAVPVAATATAAA
ncbi:WD repeat-containing protein 48 [Sporothrix brasiliensis 5110]|uniref:WD repeat-containing protein 48 n=1 Tax=Sporothrix brasiliensis 5110 TaxID=1398154 RepID=A0A0C2IMW2_9PEZI|nr:WD repeat-containing protein 48 [Sporothrix brasiliensis 5110]KIH86327.1 WD repeat-containing protein 48 [Sporothrix brasiliensis 5110]